MKIGIILLLTLFVAFLLYSLYQAIFNKPSKVKDCEIEAKATKIE
jgi:hypothetical protein